MSLAVEPRSQTAAATIVTIAEFSSRTDKWPRASRMPWGTLVELLTKHAVRREKDGPGWSPTVYQEGATRSKKGVQLVTALALDFDHVEPPRGLLDGYTWVGHTTFSHTPQDPRWRVVIQLARPVKAEDWPGVWLRVQRYFGATADEACKDCSRFFYRPTALPDGERLAERHDGVALDVDDLPALPVEPTRRQQPARSARTGTATRYTERAVEDELGEVAAAVPGGRNARLNRAAFSLGQFVGAGELARRDIEDQLERAAERSGLVAEDGIDQVRRTIASGLDAGVAQPRVIPAPATPLTIVPPSTNGHSAATPPPPEPPDDGDDHLRERPSFHQTDLGNARRLVVEHGQNVHYCFQTNRWLIWRDARHWAEDTVGEIERIAKTTIQTMYSQAAELDDAERKSLAKWALKSESHRAITSMIALARSEHGVPVTTDQLDHNPWLLTVGNGTLDLRTGELRTSRREDLITKTASVDYDPSAQCPTWEAFLDRIMASNRGLIAFLQRAIGYSLTGSTRERVTFFLFGTGANGKSTLLETIGALLGDYAETTRAETLMVKTYDGGIPNDIAALRAARLVSTSETEEGKRLAEALVKAITGGDTLSARFMRGEFFKFKPAFKLWLATNHKPTIRGTDPAIWDRIRLVPFEVRIPDAEQDRELPAKLREELPGIMAWAVRGCLDWQRNGLGDAARSERCHRTLQV
jgi:P4 family phage/plasmid primase-like protien